MIFNIGDKIGGIDCIKQNKKASESLGSLELSMELIIGFEPTTCSLRMRAIVIGK